MLPASLVLRFLGSTELIIYFLKVPDQNVKFQELTVFRTNYVSLKQLLHGSFFCFVFFLSWMDEAVLFFQLGLI